MQYGGAWPSRWQAATADPVPSAGGRFECSPNSLLDEAPPLQDPKCAKEEAQAKPRQ